MATAKRKLGAPTDEPLQEGGDSNKPTHLVSYYVSKDTYIQALVWERAVTSGDTSFSAFDVSLRKRANVGGVWESYYTFRGSEIPFVVRALTRAEEWILDQRRSENVPF